MSDPVRMPRGKRGLVGARARPRPTSDQEIPISLERVLLLAARDARFREMLFADREAALTARGLELRPSEVATLRAMPESVLQATIERLDPPRQRNQVFAKAVAAAVAGTMLSTVSCLEAEGGVAPDPYDGGGDAGAEVDGDAEMSPGSGD